MFTRKIDLAPTLFIIGYHLFLLIALPIYLYFFSLSATLVYTTLILVFISGLAITAGYHRLYSHSCYKAHPITQLVFLFFGSLATQGSVIQWCHDHRLHHAFIDSEKDPYSIKKGFWHAHVFWMFFKTTPIDPKIVSDLLRNPLLAFQHKHYVFCMLLSNIVTVFTVGFFLNDYLGSFLFIWWVRLFLLHHTTWFINSLAHTWGHQNYSREHSAVDNYILSFLTYGEGYHNYHHTFSHDYRNGIRWYHFDPTKWLIWILSKIGLAKDLRKVNNLRIKCQLISEHKEKLLQVLRNPITKDKVIKLGDQLISQLHTLQSLYEKYKSIPKQEAASIKNQIKITKKDWKEAWSNWKRLLKSLQSNNLIHSK